MASRLLQKGFAGLSAGRMNCTTAQHLSRRTLAGSGVPHARGGFLVPTTIPWCGDHQSLAFHPITVPLCKVAMTFVLVR